MTRRAPGMAHIDPRTLAAALDALLPEDRTVAVDSGHFMGFPADVPARPRRGVRLHAGYQSIGLGLGSGMGAAIARPDRLTVAAWGTAAR